MTVQAYANCKGQHLVMMGCMHAWNGGSPPSLEHLQLGVLLRLQALHRSTSAAHACMHARSECVRSAYAAEQRSSASSALAALQYPVLCCAVLAAGLRTYALSTAHSAYPCTGCLSLPAAAWPDLQREDAAVQLHRHVLRALPRGGLDVLRRHACVRACVQHHACMHCLRWP